MSAMSQPVIAKSLLVIATLGLILQPFSTPAFAIAPSDADIGIEAEAMAASIKMGNGKVDESSAENKSDYKYVTREEISLKGLVLKGDAKEGDSLIVLPQEIVLPAETTFHMEDRTDDGEGNRFVKIGIETGDELNSTLSYWVNEGDFVRAVYATHMEETSQQYAELTLDDVDGRDAKFSYGQSYAVAGPNQFMMPVMGARRSSPPGMRMHPILKTRKMHAGWDLAAPTGTPVMAAADGVISFAGKAGGYGNLIKIRHGKLETRYGHLSRILVKSGQSVRRGFVIGKVGSTGRSTGPHLHFEQRSASGAVIFDRPNESMLSQFKKGGAAAVSDSKPDAKTETTATVVKKESATVAKKSDSSTKSVVKKSSSSSDKANVKASSKSTPARKKKRSLRRKAVVKPQETGWPQPFQW